MLTAGNDGKVEIRGRVVGSSLAEERAESWETPGAEQTLGAPHLYDDDWVSYLQHHTSQCTCLQVVDSPEANESMLVTGSEDATLVICEGFKHEDTTGLRLQRDGD
jgi:hypothetical protein